MFEYIQENKTWIFSGIGVAILTFIISLGVQLFRRKRNSQYRNITIKGNADSSVIISGDRNSFDRQ